MEPKRPIHNVLYTIPRTASHLLVKLLNLPSQPSLHRTENGKDGYFFLPAVALRFQNNLFGKKLEDWKDEERKDLQDAFNKGLIAWERLIDEAEKDNKGTYIKEHINWLVDPISEARFFNHTIPSNRPKFPDPPTTYPSVSNISTEHPVVVSELNPTSLPSSLLYTTKPSFLIRTPYLTFPSALRTSLANQPLSTVLGEQDAQKWECTYHWTLSLYRFYTANDTFPPTRQTYSHDVTYPVIIDAEDLHNEALVRKYARAVGLDEEVVRFEWAAASGGDEGGGEAGDGVDESMTKSIRESTGVRRDMLGTGRVWDLREEKRKWVVEFGEVLAERLAGMVEASLGDYELLRRHRLRV